MKNITISDEAYNEFKEFLDENKVASYNIRINLAGYGCSGPVFNDITFIAESKLVDEFGGFKLLSSEENDGRGLSLRPVIKPEGGCATCGGGCH